jgi:prostaglandin-endoperoxide synthase 2
LAWVSTIPVLGRLINRIVTNTIASATKPRPRPYSLWWPANSLDARSSADQTNGPITDYASWPSLTDRSFSARHLDPAPEAFIRQLPPDAPYDRKTGSAGAITSLFARPRDSSGQSLMTPDRSSVLFMFFAQWFTDSILRIDPKDRRRNTSNHDVDLCQIYGLNEQETRCLRSCEHGHLRSQDINGQEFPDYLGERDSNGQWPMANGRLNPSISAVSTLKETRSLGEAHTPMAALNGCGNHLREVSEACSLMPKSNSASTRCMRQD